MLKMFTVYDSKAEAFIQPFYEQTTASAQRAFSNAANNETHQFAMHGGDYTLFELGIFDQESGLTTLLPSMINLGLAITYTRAPAVPATPALPAPITPAEPAAPAPGGKGASSPPALSHTNTPNLTHIITQPRTNEGAN